MKREEAIEELKDFKNKSWDGMPEEVIDIAIEALEQMEEVDRVGMFAAIYGIQSQESKTGKCRTCKYGEIYNDLWCKCHDPLLDGVMVKMTDQCRAEEIIDLNRKYKAGK